MLTPKQKYHAFCVFIYGLYHSVGKLLPAEMGMGVCLITLDTEHSIEQQCALTGPAAKIAMAWIAKSRDCIGQLLKHVLQ